MNNVLVINAGSSSVKFSLHSSAKNNLTRIFSAKAVRLFQDDAEIKIFDEQKNVLVEKNLTEVSVELPNHKNAIEFFLGWLTQQSEIRLIAVAHRVVHGGPNYSKPVIITAEILKQLNSYQPLAPLHQQHNLAPVDVIAQMYPDLPQVACFDTAFHQTMPELAKQFALPKKYFDEGVRRYGFHGLSYEYIVEELAKQQDIDNKKIIVAHLGNGASMCAIDNKKSVATTMSFTPLDGLVMGTRCGDLDPGVVLHLINHYSMTVEDVTTLLYKNSGLLGISDHSNNMRKLLESKQHDAIHAVDLFCYQANRMIGSLTAALGGLDLLVFTAGIGENSAAIREKICQLGKWLGMELDAQANQRHKRTISSQKSTMEIAVIPTNEALMIAQHALQLVKN